MHVKLAIALATASVAVAVTTTENLDTATQLATQKLQRKLLSKLANEGQFVDTQGPNASDDFYTPVYYGPCSRFWCGEKASTMDVSIGCISFHLDPETHEVTTTWPAKLEGSIESLEKKLLLPKGSGTNPDVTWDIPKLQVNEGHEYTLKIGFLDEKVPIVDITSTFRDSTGGIVDDFRGTDEMGLGYYYGRQSDPNNANSYVTCGMWIWPICIE
eukprot:Clim_evm102s109 gene=Clim_evmTU102s109